jgi:ribose 5-phosphate isomerase A
MNPEDLRKKCAKEAMKFIKNHSVIGLGAGRNIAALIELIREEAKQGLHIQVVTPSFETKRLCKEHGIEVLPMGFVAEVSVAFDGCGEVDRNFVASKGGGGIHTKEKLVATMAKDYIILVDESRYTSTLTFEQTVAVDVIQDSLYYVLNEIKKLGGAPVVRTSNIKDSYITTDEGHFLIDIKFDDVPDVKTLNQNLNDIVGVVGTSLFTDEVSKIIVAREDHVDVYSRYVD